MVEEQTKEEEKSVSIVDEAKAIRDEILKAKDELKLENERSEKLASERLLSGTAGINEPVEKKEETAVEYKDRILKNG